ncbi:MAG: Re/Si-specific NAD(P)(+) transhydrogenase subunit alpha [Acidobacteria bacterium]|nr:Re/Si-specific NAD(P)(+) transhydrogenase subunit alpha [Acidobacteriota bacterium]
MNVIVGVPKETFPSECRVAMTPSGFDRLTKAGMKLVVEQGAGDAAGFPDSEYEAKGAKLVSRAEVFAQAGVILQVRTLGANPAAGEADSGLLRKGQIVIGMSEPLTALDQVSTMAKAGVTLFAMELIPRITRAQAMDALSSMATVAGYRAVLAGAQASARMFPMLTTAAGTIAPARVFVLGVGVAGLQALATAKRLGAVCSAYDVRAAAREQAESVGAKFIALEIETTAAEGSGGYAKAMDEEFYRKQRELLTKVLREQDVVITTAAVPGRKAPVLITAEMVRAMHPGAVIVDMAAERGGNCELTRAGETVVEAGVSILGITNLPSESAYHASQMYAKNVATLLEHLAPNGVISLNLTDEITRETLVTHEGAAVHPRVAALLAPVLVEG